MTPSPHRVPPSHRLITGPRAALELALAQAVKNAKASDPFAAVTVLVGETLLRPYLRRRIAEILGGHVNVEIVTPGELAMTLGAPTLLAAGRQPMPPLVDPVLVRQATAGPPERFGDVVHTPGFENAMIRTLRDLRGAGIDAEALTTAGAAVDDERLLDLATLYAAVEARRHDWFTVEDAVLAADPTKLHGEHLLVHALWTPTVIQRRLLDRLAERVPVTVFLPAVDGPADAATTTMRAWAAAADATWSTVANPSATTNAAHAADATVPSLVSATTADNTPWAPFDGPPAPAETGTTATVPFTPSPTDDTVTVIEAPDPTREVDEVVRTVLRWADDGIPFHEMAIAYRHTEPHRTLIETSLREADVPVYLHDAPTIAERPLGRRITALLRLLDGRLQRADVSAFLADAFLPDATFHEYGGISTAAWDGIARDAGIVAGPDQWRDRLAAFRDALRARHPDDDRPEWATNRLAQADQLERFVGDLRALAERRPENAPWAEHLAFLRDAVDRYVIGAEGVLDELESLTVLTDDLPASSVDGLVADALERLRANEHGEGAFAQRGVIVADALSLRHVGVRAMAIVGLVDGRFPAAPAEDPLLLDADRRDLNAAHGWDLPLRADAPDPEPLQFAGLLGAGPERLAVGYARTDGTADRPALPSTFIRGVVDALTGDRAEIEDFATAAEPWLRRIRTAQFGAQTPAEARNAEEWLITALESDDPATRAAAAGVLSSERPAYVRATAADAARWSTDLTPYDGALSHEALDDLRAMPRLQRPFSPTALENYATCPQRTLLKDILGLKPREDPEDVLRLDALNTGSVLHHVLERFLTELGERGARDGDPDDHRGRLHDLLDEELDALSAQGLTGYPVLLEQDRHAMRRDLALWLQTELEEDDRALADFQERLEAGEDAADGTPLTPPMPFLERGQEVRFGALRPGEDPAAGGPFSRDEPLELPGDGPPLLVHGRIDRVRATADGSAFRVVDYKTGKPRADPNDIAFGRKLQLPIYLWAAARALGVDSTTGTAEYDHFRHPGAGSRIPFHGAVLGEQEHEIRGVVEHLAHGIHGGDFHREPVALHGRKKNGDPDPRSNCGYCDFEPLCHPQREAMRRLKADDPRARFWERQGEDA